MSKKLFFKIIFLVSFIFCVHSSVIKEENITKSISQESYVSYGCSGCYSYNNMVCVDDSCYCKPNYYYTSRGCVYKSCTTNSECYQTQDIDRHCDSFGSCVCDTGYYEDWNNGRKCTDDNYTYTYTHVDTWAWAWIFLVLPAAFLSVFICLRRRRLHLAHTHQAHCPVQQPPPYVYAPQHQQGVTVIRY